MFTTFIFKDLKKEEKNGVKEKQAERQHKVEDLQM